MIMGLFFGRRYSARKYATVVVITLGVALFMGGGDSSAKAGADAPKPGAAAPTPEEEAADQGVMLVGGLLLFASLCFDGATGAYEDKIMGHDHVGPFELMYNIQLGKAILAFISLMALNEVHHFFQMVAETGWVLLALGLTGAMGQVFIFVTISKFGALTCSIIGLARKIVTLVTSLIIYHHEINSTQGTGLLLAIAGMVYNFVDKKSKKKAPEEDAAAAPDAERAGLLGGGGGGGGGDGSGDEEYADGNGVDIEVSGEDLLGEDDELVSA